MDQQAINELDGRTDELSRVGSAPLESGPQTMPSISPEAHELLDTTSSETASVQVMPAVATPSPVPATPPTPAVVISDPPAPQPGFGYRVIEPPTASAFEFADTSSLDEPEKLSDYQTPSKPRLMRHWFVNEFSRLRTVLIAAILVVTLGTFFGYGIHALLTRQGAPKTSSLTGKLPNEPVINGSLAKNQTLKINAKLEVNNNTLLNGDLTVTGTTTLQGVVVKADTAIGGNLNVQGNGNFSGNITASNFISGTLIVSGNSDFSGNINAININGVNIASTDSTVSNNLTVGGTLVAKNLQGDFQGSFSGDGSGLTNLEATNCADCVRLQGTNPIAQTGNVSLDGDVTVAGRLTGRNVLIRPLLDSDSVATVQAADGTNILNIDSTHRTLVVNTLLPQQAGSIRAGSITPGLTATVINPSIANTYNDNQHWSVMGSDGLIRAAYVDWSSRQIHYILCINTDCSNSDDHVIATDVTNGIDAPVIALDQSGNAYIGFIGYNSPNNVWHIMHCLDEHCTQTTDQIVSNSLYPYGYNYSIAVDGQNHADFVFDSYDYTTTPRTYAFQMVHCTNNDCSTNTVSTLASSDQTNGGYYETSTIVTGQDGLPRITYGEDGGDLGLRRLYFVRCQSADCATNTTTLIDPADADYWNSMALGSDGFARIVYQSSNSQSINYALCGDQDCTSIIRNTIVSGASYTGYADIALDSNNLPVVSYFVIPSGGGDRIMYMAKCKDQQCSQMNTRAIEDSGTYGYDSSIFIAQNGFPTMLYVVGDYSTNALKVAVFGTADGSDIVVPSVQTDGTNIGSPSQLFGQIYAQGLNLQSASSSSTLIINQQGVINGTGPIASFQINGVTHAEFDQNGTFIENSNGLSDSAQFQVNGTTHVKVDQNGTLVLQPTNGQTADLQQWNAADGSTALGFNSSGKLYIASGGQLSVTDTTNDVTTLDQTGLKVTDSNQQVQALLTNKGNLQLGPQQLQQFGATNYNNELYVSSADLNGDGLPDLITQGGDYTYVTVRLNDGTGKLKSPTKYPIGAQYQTPLTTDVNGDGKPDIIKAGYCIGGGSSCLGVLLNNGDGTFGSAAVQQVDTLSQYYFDQLHTADLNGDGYPDAVVLNIVDATIHISLNNGNGTFAPAQLFDPSLPQFSYAIGFGDFDQDGKLDMVLGSSNSNADTILRVYPGNGDGTFGAPTQYTFANNSFIPSSLTTGDFNGDGKPDLAWSAGGQIYMSLNNGTGSLGNPTDVGYGSPVITTDFNGDGKPDFAGFSGPAVNTYMNNGNGTFTTKSYPSTIGGTLQLFDINHDGHPDLVLGGYSMQTFTNTGTGNLTVGTSQPLAGGYFLEANDFANNGTLNPIATQLYPNSGTVIDGPIVSPKVEISSSDQTNTLLTLSGSGGTGDFLDVQDSSQNILAKIDSSGSITTPSLTVSTINPAGGSYGLNTQWFNCGGYSQVVDAGNCPVAATVTYGPINLLNFGADRPSNLPSVLPPGVLNSNETARATGWVKADFTGTYTFYTNSDDGSRLYIDNNLVVNNWFNQGMTERSGTVNLVAGQWYPIKVEFFQGGGSADLTVSWSEASVPKALIPRDHLLSIDPSTVGSIANFNVVQIQADTQFNGQLQDSAASGSYANFNSAGSNGGAVTIATRSAGNVGLQLQGASGQTADILQAVDSNNTVLLRLAANGDLTVSGSIISNGFGVFLASATNYLPDPTFANGPSGGRGSGTKQLVTGQSGTATGRAVKLTPNNDWTTVGENCSLGGTGNYTTSFIAWTDSGTAPITFLEGPSNAFGGFTATTTKQRFSYTWNHTSGCNSFEIGPSSGTNPVYIADWQVETGSAATPFIYGDGGSGYSWSGTANNSSSTRKAGIISGGGVYVNGELGVVGATGAVTCCGNAPNAPLAINAIGGKGGTTQATGQSAGQGGSSIIMGGPGGDGIVINTNGGTGGDITLKGGTGGTGTGNGNGGNGGSLVFQGGTPGTGVASGAIGQISLQASGGNVVVGVLTTPDSTAELAVGTGSTTKKGIVIQAVAGQTADLLQAQSSTGAILASISAAGNLTVKAATVNGTLTLNGHLITGNTSGSTTATVGAASGTGGTCTVSGNDTSGEVTIVTGGSGVATGVLCTINFSSAYGVAPHTVLSPVNAASTGLQIYKTNNTINFVLNTNNAPTISTTYKFDYVIAQ